jgi:hypothetical protein
MEMNGGWPGQPRHRSTFEGAPSKLRLGGVFLSWTQTEW